MLWMFINIVDVIDEQLKLSIKKQIDHKILKNLRTKGFYNYMIIDVAKFNMYSVNKSEF